MNKIHGPFVLYNGGFQLPMLENWDQSMVDYVYQILYNDPVKYKNASIMFVPGTYSKMMKDYE